MGTGSEPKILTFAGFRLDAARRRLSGPDGAAIVLQPRVFDLLSLFLARPGEPISKQEIMDAVWPDTTVDENNLNQAVSTLRRALGDDHREPRLIATLPRRGYQLIVPVLVESTAPEPAAPAAPMPPAAAATAPIAAPSASAVAAEPEGDLGGALRLGATAAALAAMVVLAALVSPARAPAPAAPPEASIAVLPFADMSAAGDQGYFADGVAEEILVELARLEGLRVAGRLSSAAAAEESVDPRAIGRALGVAHVLEGGVRKDGDRLRVTAQLVSTADGYQLWSETYDGQLGDVFAIQDEIADSVADALSIRLGIAPHGDGVDTRGTDSIAAYDHYLRGRAFWAQSGANALSAAIEELNAAVEIDPDYGAAWASMARAADLLIINEPSRAAELRALQAEATRRAGEADPASWEAIALRARMLMRQWKWSEAAAALTEAASHGRPTPVEAAEIEGAFYMQTGRARDAVAVFQAARESDPLSFTLAALTSWALDLAGETDAALAEYARAETLPGDETDWAFQQLLRLLQKGDTEAVDALFAHYPYQEDAAGETMRRLASVWRSRDDALAVLVAAKDDPAISGPHRIDAFALIAASYGDSELALAMLRDEYFTRHGGATAHLWHPLMREVRSTDGFKQLVADLGFVDYWRATGNWPDACSPLGTDDFTCS